MKSFVRFWVIIVIVTMIQSFWDVTPCPLVNNCLDPKDEGNKLVRITPATI
jgi:hypothetical protein